MHYCVVAAQPLLPRWPAIDIKNNAARRENNAEAGSAAAENTRNTAANAVTSSDMPPNVAASVLSIFEAVVRVDRGM
jgi:hypothetical protein